MLIETYVETPRHAGTVYKTSGWIHIWASQGRGRYDRHTKRDQPKNGNLAQTPPRRLAAHARSAKSSSPPRAGRTPAADEALLAPGPDAVYHEPCRLAPERNIGFLRACLTRLARVDFADSRSRRIYLRASGRRAEVLDEAALAAAASCADAAAAFTAQCPELPASRGGGPGSGVRDGCGPLIDPGDAPTLGRWAGACAA